MWTSSKNKSPVFGKQTKRDRSGNVLTKWVLNVPKQYHSNRSFEVQGKLS